MKQVWYVWCKALGDKASDCSKTADRVAIVRSVIVLVNFITCFFIMANTIKHW